MDKLNRCAWFQLPTKKFLNITLTWILRVCPYVSQLRRRAGHSLRRVRQLPKAPKILEKNRVVEENLVSNELQK